MLLAKGLNVFHPIIQKTVIDRITNTYDDHTAKVEIFFLIGLYALVRFSADFTNYIREIPFANVSASAEVYIAHMVYNHVQNQSLSFHLSRETGKVIRVVSRGSQSFAQILRYTVFSLLPIIIELIFVLVIIGILYPIEIFAVTLLSVILYIFLTVTLTEWRARYFKQLALKDTEYN